MRSNIGPIILCVAWIGFACGFIAHDGIIAVANNVSEAMVQLEVADPPPMADCPHNLPVIQPAVAAE